jgi:hypothetical protein
MAITKIPAAGFSDAVNFRNIIINGDMSIAQRGTSTSGVTTTDGYYACDRFFTRTDTGTWTISQSTDVPTGQGFANSFKLDCTSAGTSNADEVIIRYNSEGQFLQYLKYGTSNAESLTCSFWIKSNKTGAYSLNINNYNTSQNRLISFAYNIDSANTWEKKIITLPGDTVRSINNSNTQDFQIQWIFGAASSFTSGGVSNTWIDYAVNRSAPSDLAGLGGSTDDEVYITGIQLEAGTSASDFEFLPHDVNLRRCQRYYEELVSNDGHDIYWSGYTSSSYDDASPYSFKVEKRAVPSGSFSGSWTYSNVTGSTFDLTQRTKELITFVWSTSGAGRYYVHNGGSGDKIKFDAEL